MADPFTEMLNGTTSVKSVMDILFITIEIEGAIVVQVAIVQSLYKRRVKQWLIIIGATVRVVTRRVTTDRVRGSKGSKVLRTRKIKQNQWNSRSIWGYFCGMSCYNDFAKEYMAEIIRIAPRLEPLETPINDPKKSYAHE